jgi:hypothetical protein
MSSPLHDISRKLGQRVQWLAHDKANGQAAQRRLRQQRTLAARSMKEMYGIDVDANGRTPAGLIVPGAVPESR